MITLTAKKQGKSVEETTLGIIPAELSPEFEGFLRIMSDRIDIRVFFPAHAEAATRELFARENLTLPDDIVPLKSGTRGGNTVQRTVAGEIWFPETTLPIPGDGKVTIQGDRVKLNNIRVILAALKLGLHITKYTKA